MDLASNVARVTKIKYEQGVGSNFEVVEAESSLREAQTNYYSSLFDAITYKVDLDRAYGKLITKTTQESK
jgi:outer membrane protein TolC